MKPSIDHFVEAAQKAKAHALHCDTLSAWASVIRTYSTLAAHAAPDGPIHENAMSRVQWAQHEIRQIQLGNRY